jgi:hypothetical protein
LEEKELLYYWTYRRKGKALDKLGDIGYEEWDAVWPLHKEI